MAAEGKTEDPSLRHRECLQTVISVSLKHMARILVS